MFCALCFLVGFYFCSFDYRCFSLVLCFCLLTFLFYYWCLSLFLCFCLLAFLFYYWCFSLFLCFCLLVFLFYYWCLSFLCFCLLTFLFYYWCLSLFLCFCLLAFLLVCVLLLIDTSFDSCAPLLLNASFSFVLLFKLILPLLLCACVG